MKPCTVCGKMMTRPYQESRARFEARKTCSRRCAGRSFTLAAGRQEPMPRRIKLPQALNVTPPPTTALRICTGCGCTIHKPDGMTWAKYRGRSTCGAAPCKTGGSRRAVETPPSRGVKAVVAELMLTVTQRQIDAYHDAPADERRLFDPIVAAVAAGRRPTPKRLPIRAAAGVS